MERTLLIPEDDLYEFCEPFSKFIQMLEWEPDGSVIRIEGEWVDAFLDSDKEPHWSTSRFYPARSRYIPKRVRELVFGRDEKCVFCGSDEYLQLDHRKPFSKGGSHAPSNLQVLCRSCNASKGAAWST